MTDTLTSRPETSSQSGAENSSDTAPTPEITVVNPCFCEENGIVPTLRAVQTALDGAALRHEIIVVDDGSTDGTREVLEASPVSIKVLRNSQNRGYGASLKRGIHHAKAPLIAIIDADGTYPPEEIPNLIAAIHGGECDMAVAARTGEKVSIPAIRRPPKWLLGKVANFVANRKIPDMNSGLRVFPKEVADRMSSILPDGFSFTTTITLAMMTSGYEVSFHPINYYKRVGSSKIRPISDTLNFLQLILKMALYFAPLRIFLPLSAILLALGVGWAFYSLLVLGELADVSTLIIVMTAVQVAATGMVAELIRWRLPRREP